jgi:uncharacterized protein YdcH (DUF465 family)
MPERTKLIDSIRKQNREFRKLEEMHKEYETRLDELMKHIYLTPTQEILKQEIKKQKLRTKDRMAEIIQGFLTINNQNGD